MIDPLSPAHFPGAKSWVKQCRQEAENILQWWMDHTVDEQNGGFYGRIDGKGVLHPEAQKGIVLNTRILWGFSIAARVLGKPEYRRLADRAFDYLCRYFWDAEYGGVYWMIDHKGNPTQSHKHIYAQAFAVYAFSEYYLCSKKPEALQKALEQFRLIENHSRDPKLGGYFEWCERDGPIPATLRNGGEQAGQAKTMNTHLHLMEAFTWLWIATKDPGAREALEHQLDCHLNHIISPHHHLILYLDENWTPSGHEVSYGHDIECTWLILEAAESLGQGERIKEVALKMAEKALAKGLDTDGGMYYEADENYQLTRPQKDWWPQCEAMVGFLNAWQLTQDKNYWKAARNSWQFIQTEIIDRQNGEWFWTAGADKHKGDKAGPWKAPYHNLRCCLEVMKRLG